MRGVANSVKTALLFGLLSALLVGIGGGLYGSRGLLIGLLIAVGINAFSDFNSAHRIALRTTRPAC